MSARAALRKLPWPTAWLGLWFLAAITHSIARAFQDPGSHQLALSLLSPSGTHPLGCDAFGRDLLSTVLGASLVSSGFSFLATGFSLIAAIALGGLLALAPERPRFVLLRALDISLAFPSLLLALAWAALRGPGWNTLLVSLIVGTLPSFTRLMYVRARELLSEDYVEAAHGLGAGPLHLIRVHLAPGLTALGRVKAPNLFAGTLMAEATLSFLGVGAPIGRDTWGSLLAQGKEYLFEAPHVALGAGLPLVLTVLALQFLLRSDR